jgi:toxin ParE1/3/4
MSQYRLTDEAFADIGEIHFSLGQLSIAAADRLLVKFFNNFRSLARLPEMGSPCDEIVPGLRYLVVKKYVIYYRVVPEGVEIARVVSGQRDIDTVFGLNN